MEKSNISYYMELLLKSNFPQFHPMDTREFTRFVNARGFRIREESLEFYDEKEILRPAFLFHKPRVNKPDHKYASMLIMGPRSWNQYFEEGFISFPKDGIFEPWKNYKDGYDDKIVPYYHPFQFVSVRLTSNLGIRLSPKYFENLHDHQKQFETQKNLTIENVQSSVKASKETWNPIIGMLMLLEESYGPYVKGFFSPSIDEKEAINEWRKWKKETFDPKKILSICNITIENVKEYYDKIATLGNFCDPLVHWYPFLQLIQRTQKRHLKKEAILAQDYYDLSKIVQYFLEDLGSEKMPDPDDLWDGSKGVWKGEIFGKPFDYSNPKVRKKIFDYYLAEPRLKMTVIFEGDTEEYAIKEILKERGIFWEDEIFLYNARGMPQFESRKIDGLIGLAKLQDVDVFVIADNDQGDTKEKFDKEIQLGNLQDGRYHVWEKDFEYDNFGLSNVLSIINSELENHHIELFLREDEILEAMNKEKIVMMLAIEKKIKHDTGWEFRDIISKTEICKRLIEPRLAQIKLETSERKYTPKLPLEEVLQNILKLMPKWIIHSSEY